VITSIKKMLDVGLVLRQNLLNDEASLQKIEAAAKEIFARLKRGGVVYTCGNGGSACDALHFTEELVARFKRERPGYKSMFFGDVGSLTCWSNDYEYDTAFARYAETFCGKDDVLIAISTSGNSSNVLKAASIAMEKGSFVLALAGRDGGKLAQVCNSAIVIPSQETERIQELHITVIHILCELIENQDGYL
jgi:D-sedoheptulose 7-phosphate isomerase